MNDSTVAAEAAQKAQEVLPLSEQFWTEALKLGAVGFIAVALLALMASLLTWGCKALYTRLFDEKNGLITLLFNDQRTFIKDTSTNVKKMARTISTATKSQARNNKEIINSVDRLTVHTVAHQVAKEDWLLTICRLLRNFAYRDGVNQEDVEPLIKELEEMVHDARDSRMRHTGDAGE